MKKWLSFLLLAGIIILITAPSWKSGLQKDGSFVINTGHDLLWHLSLAAETKRSLPPTFPAMNNTPLYNYHYLTDTVFGLLHQTFKIPLPLLYFKIAPLILVSLLSLGILKLSKLLTKSNFASFLALITALFSGSLAFASPWLNKNQAWTGNAFMLSLPYAILVNLHSILGFALLFWGLYYFTLSLKNKHFKNHLLSVFLFTLLFTIKTFYALPILLSLGVLSLKKGLKNPKYLATISASFLLVLLAYKLTSQNYTQIHRPTLEWQPGWLLTKMVEDQNRFPLPNFFLKQLHYQETQNVLRLTQLSFYKLAIFILGNFWIKLLGLVFLLKSKWPKELKIFLSLTIFFSLFLTLTLVPNPDHYNAMQFGRVAVILIGWLFGLYLAQKLPKKIALPLLFISLTTFYFDFFAPNKMKGLVISPLEYQALEYIQKNAPLESIFLVDSQKGNKIMLVSGLGQRRVYFDDYKVAQLIGADYQPRSKSQKDFFEGKMNLDQINQFLKITKADYLYLYQPLFRLDQYELPEPIFNNPEVAIFKLD